jgi:hypothetical protein
MEAAAAARYYRPQIADSTIEATNTAAKLMDAMSRNPVD